MIASLCGTLLEISGATLVLEVSGVGYELGVSQTTINALPEVGTSSVVLYCRLRPTEQAINLYGFATKEERAVFDKLVTVSGVGPKVALAILSSFTPAELAQIIALQDEKQMQSVSGVGKKMAGRLLLELKGLFASDEEFQKLAGLAGGATNASSLSAAAGEPSLTTALAEATEALLGLGYASKEAEVALQTVVKEHAAKEQGADGPDGAAGAGNPADNKPLTVEQLLKQALTILGGGHHVGS